MVECHFQVRQSKSNISHTIHFCELSEEEVLCIIYVVGANKIYFYSIYSNCLSRLRLSQSSLDVFTILVSHWRTYQQNG